ncbi:MAG TPA: hypothetical protein PK978_07870 [Paludibacter sp.]|nr:hypothetical protein [Bacteroidales bacterium]HOG06133.1 hypothetical protein [Paludibacter sp.]
MNRRFVLAGIFASQEEIDSWAYIEGVTIGSYKYLDFNGDALINEMDNIQLEPIYVSLDGPYVKDVYIGK